MQMIVCATVAVGVEAGEVEIDFGEEVQHFGAVDGAQIDGMDVTGGRLWVVQRMGIDGHGSLRCYGQCR